MAQVDNVIAWAKKRVGSSAYSGLCQKFVADAYAYGGNMTRRSAATATAAYKSWCVSKSKNNIPAGAAVYFNGSNSSVGHVGLYIGGGQVIHAYPRIVISSLYAIPGYRGWGWNGGVPLQGGSAADQQVKNVYGGASNSSNKSASETGTSMTVTGTEEKVQVFHAQDKGNINKWGLLRYFEEVDNPSIGQVKANTLLNLYNKKHRKLTVSDAFGDVTVRAGTLIPVNLNLGDLKANNYMLVNKVVHKFTKDTHTMDLTLDGAWPE